MKLSVMRMSWIALVFSLGALVAISYVQNRPTPENPEVSIRFLTEKLGLMLTPILIVFAYRDWIKINRTGLPAWRNGLGLASLVITSLAWTFFTGLLILGATRPSAVRFMNLDWMQVLFCCTLVAAFLATTLKGAARVHGIAAALWIWILLQSTIFF
jgi:hypothetical protein